MTKLRTIKSKRDGNNCLLLGPVAQGLDAALLGAVTPLLIRPDRARRRDATRRPRARLRAVGIGTALYVITSVLCLFSLVRRLGADSDDYVEEASGAAFANLLNNTLEGLLSVFALARAYEDTDNIPHATLWHSVFVFIYCLCAIYRTLAQCNLSAHGVT